MKQKRSMDEALNAAKALRKQVTPSQPPSETEAASDSHLKVVEAADRPAKVSPVSGPNMQPAVEANQGDQQHDAIVSNPKPVWVRHTIGLRDTTSLDLRDAADVQKRKERRGQLKPGDPANEQEIADLGIRLALEHLGLVSKPLDA